MPIGAVIMCVFPTDGASRRKTERKEAKDESDAESL